MNKLCIRAILILFIFPIGLSHANAAEDTFVFNRNLNLGDRGEDVRQLQILLNKDLQTRVSEAGAGSLGLETDFFGLKTHSAVIRFQNKHAQEVLLPLGLSSGTGYFGPSTRAKANSLMKTYAPQTDTSVKINPETSYVSYIDPESGIETYISALKEKGGEGGYGAEFSDSLEKEVRKISKNNPKVIDDFVKEIQKASAEKVSSDTGFLGSVSAIIRSLSYRIIPKANAATGIPFGGRIVFVFFCPCSGTFQIALAPPLPPTFPVVLDYVPGTQAFLSYNLPRALHVLGEYVPAVGLCLIPHADGCDRLPSWGLITPKTGSSPI